MYTISNRSPSTGYPITSATVTADWGKSGYRLPTEAQWEYAAKGGNGSPGNYTYSGSNTIGNVAWYYDNSENKTHEVGKKQANGLGIYDMSGNVWEWCWDWYGSSYYSSSPGTDPVGPAAGSGRVLRGGSWYSGASYARSASRGRDDPYFRYNLLGFRLVRPVVLGDTGPGGGKIFYYSETGFTCYTSAADTTGMLCHYLEAAPADMSSILAWASSGYTSTSIPGTETAIGSGRKNTALILATDANAPAAKACKDYRDPKNLTDWFLPSKDELNQLYLNKSYVGNMGTNTYWSSSQDDNHYDLYAWGQNFNYGSQANPFKYGGNYVRAIRAF